MAYMINFVADNMPFDSTIMQMYAEEWNFNLTTIGPNYPPSSDQSRHAILSPEKFLMSRVGPTENDVAYLL